MSSGTEGRTEHRKQTSVSIPDLNWNRACPQPLFAALSTLPLQVTDETPTACWHSIKGSS